MSLPATRRLFAGLLLLFVAMYFARHGWRPAAVAGVGAVSAAAVAYGALGMRSPRVRAWLMLALGIVVLSAGDVVYSLTLPRVRPLDYPTATDILYLVAYLPLSVGLLWLGRPRLASRDWALILDTVALSLAGALIVWITLIRPAIVGEHLTGVGKATAIASWVGFLAVLAACARVILAWRTNVALAIASLGVVAFLVSDFLYGIALVNGSGPDAGPVDLGFLAFCVLVGAAALHPSMVDVASAPYVRHQLGPWRLAMLAIALLIAPTLLLVQATEGPITTAVAIAVVSAAIGVLMLVRLAVSGRVYRRRVKREQASRLASRALVVATTAEDVQKGLSDALARMLPANLAAQAYLIDRGPPNLGPRAATGTPSRSFVRTRFGATDVPDVEISSAHVTPLAGTADMAELRVAVSSPQAADSERVVVFRAPTERLAELSPTLEALAEQAGSALSRIDLIARLRVDERERYFRTLVLTSTDVILISRGERIAYATPSAAAMFGRDVVGENIDDVVRRQPHDRVHGQTMEHPLPSTSAWTSHEDGAEGFVPRQGSRTLAVLVHRRDLTDDPTVNGVVTTLRDITAERDLRRSLAYRASHDALTGLANAELLRDQLRADRDASRPDDTSLSVVLFIDLDDFKSVNDNFGHEIGDGVLVTVARRIQACLRSEDIAARLGGDEFAALLRDVPAPADAHAAAQRISDALARPATVAGIDVDCQASIGLAMASTPADFDSLLRRADTALYTAKAGGKGHWRQYRRGMLSPVRRRAEMREELSTAIREDKLTLNYQPIVDLDSSRAVGFEALIRFERTAGPAIPPEELIAIAEDNSLIIPLGEWILAKALRDVARLNLDVAQPRYVSVNVSVRQLRQPGFVDVVRSRLRASGVDGSLLVLEITESVLLSEDERAWSYLTDLRSDGIRIAIDDFGTGYASLSYLRQTAIDIVKIDRRFLVDLRSDRTRVLLEAVLRLTADLGLVQIAEGVEDEYTRATLTSLGCHFGQGFLFGQAMPITQAAARRP